MNSRPISLRDPAGLLFRHDNRLFRLIGKEGVENFEIYAKQPKAKELRKNGALVDFRLLNAAERDEVLKSEALDEWLDQDTRAANATKLIEHPVIPFISHPSEWPAEMLLDAGELTLQISQRLAGDGYRLKDAAADNVLFWGGRPIFIDALSFEKRPEGSSVWPAADQFIRSFILPLLAYRDLGLSPRISFAFDRSGPTPKDLYPLYSRLHRLRPSVLKNITLPAWLEGSNKSKEIYVEPTSGSEEKASFVFKHLLERFTRSLTALAPENDRKSVWSDYAEDNSYTAEMKDRKSTFIRTAAGDLSGKLALDVGCNTGDFSALLASLGASVIAIDSDPVVVGRCWRRTQQDSLQILPLIQNISAPTPPTGWRNLEKGSFLQRISGKIDFCVLLAVIHHIMVTDGIPLAQIIELIAELTNSDAVVEFVPRDDPMFRTIVRGRDNLYEWFDAATFETACAKRFDIVSMCEVSDGGRRLYHLRRPTG